MERNDEVNNIHLTNDYWYSVIGLLQRWYVSHAYTPFESPTKETLDDTKELLKQWGRIK